MDNQECHDGKRMVQHVLFDKVGQGWFLAADLPVNDAPDALLISPTIPNVF